MQIAQYKATAEVPISIRAKDEGPLKATASNVRLIYKSHVIAARILTPRISTNVLVHTLMRPYGKVSKVQRRITSELTF